MIIRCIHHLPSSKREKNDERKGTHAASHDFIDTIAILMVRLQNDLYEIIHPTSSLYTDFLEISRTNHQEIFSSKYHSSTICKTH